MALGPTITTAVVAAAEKLLNEALQFDQASRLQLQALAGSVIAIECTQPQLSVYIFPTETEILLAGTWDADVDATLSGTASALLQLGAKSDKSQGLFDGAVELRGDSQKLMQLQQIAEQLDIDWEAWLANHIGDVTAHQLGRGLRFASKRLKAALGQVSTTVQSYVQEEQTLTPTRTEFTGFAQAVSDTSLATDRLNARIQQLKQQISQGASPQPQDK